MTKVVAVNSALPRSDTEAPSHAVELYRRETFLEGVAADFAALHADANAWAEEQAERHGWDAAVGDGLERE